MASEDLVDTIVELVEVMVQAIVDRPGDAEVTCSRGAGDVFILTVVVDDKDVGKVIGKQGKTARSMRTIMGAAAATAGVVCQLNIVEAGEERA